MRDHLGLNYEIRPTFYPEGLKERGGTILFTNVGAEWTDEIETAIIDTLPRFNRVILDVTRFGRFRDTPKEVAELVAKLPGQGTSLAPRKAYGVYWEFQL